MNTITSIQPKLLIEKQMKIAALPMMDPSGFLGEAEREEFLHWKDESRKRQWMAGRFLARQLIREMEQHQNLSLNEIEILSRNEKGQSVEPKVFINGEKFQGSLSISHSDEIAWAVLSFKEKTRIGIDLVKEDQSDASHLLNWFSDREKTVTDFSNPESIRLHWGIKEAVYKAINQGESFSPLKIEIINSPDGTYEFYVDGADITDRCTLQVRQFDHHTAVLVEITN